MSHLLVHHSYSYEISRWRARKSKRRMALFVDRGMQRALPREGSNDILSEKKKQRNKKVKNVLPTIAG